MSEERGKKICWWKAGPFKVFWDKASESAVEVELTDITLSPDSYLIAKVKPGGDLYKALLSASWLAPCEGRIEWWEDIALLPARIMIELMERKGRVHCIIDPLPEKEGES